MRASMGDFGMTQPNPAAYYNVSNIGEWSSSIIQPSPGFFEQNQEVAAARPVGDIGAWASGNTFASQANYMGSQRRGSVGFGFSQDQPVTLASATAPSYPRPPTSGPLSTGDIGAWSSAAWRGSAMMASGVKASYAPGFRTLDVTADVPAWSSAAWKSNDAAPYTIDGAKPRVNQIAITASMINPQQHRHSDTSAWSSAAYMLPSHGDGEWAAAVNLPMTGTLNQFDMQAPPSVGQLPPTEYVVQPPVADPIGYSLGLGTMCSQWLTLLRIPWEGHKGCRPWPVDGRMQVEENSSDAKRMAQLTLWRAMVQCHLLDGRDVRHASGARLQVSKS